ncbi:alpha-mannosidase [Paenibacillus sp. MWE-103]|uniref:Alpha-mannosidase n=1 Tax=Paenibacillus artemisiicola TaxID=1172618 RepID=A0ABS3W533_9BACL|nr:glycoside hydrolase family 38 C-terminal domain-containing protein [Paenibacillus artemisiicola]MBO7743403.1 alpha-mannosidase [Paenibacillus artemisiicola]
MNPTKEIVFHVAKLLQKKERLLFTKIAELAFDGFETREQLSIGELAGRPFGPIAPGERWGGDWTYGWFRASFAVQEEAAGKRLAAVLDYGSEATVYVNGAVRGAMDLQHHDLTLTRSARAGERYEIVAEAYAGHAGVRPTFGESRVCVFEEDVYQFFIDLECLYDLRNHMDPNALRVAEIDRCLTQVFAVFDRSLRGEAMADNAKRCRAIMEPLLACVNGSTSPLLYMMGQSHLDIAWLWPIQETQRKVARTMSNQLALMEEYPEYRYVQSQPYLFQTAKELYPELYGRMKRAVAEGRIIPEGGMWVEPDTNLPGGESLIRQAMHGKRFFREEFGKDNEMLWLPDVFGYSGNMPQIMKGCGLNYFASVKMFNTYDNAGDPFPYNTFYWEGIDGTRILSHLLDYGANYPIRINPSFLIGQWNDRAQKDGIATRLTQFGHGDGGGGANRDDLEFMRRLENLEGVPRTKHGSPIAFFEDAAKRGDPVATYVGELYYPAHRGTYTTQAPIKKLNRLTEIALRETELWGAAARLSERRAYPYAELDRLWKILLLHQFHDILPGSSIHRVHEEAQAALAALNEQVNGLAADARDTIAGAGGAGVTAFNALSWARKGLVALPGGAKGISDAAGRSLPVQWHEGVGYAEVEAPSMGWAVYTVRQEEASAEASPAIAPEPAVRVSGNRLENECLAIVVNERGELASIVDKATGTEWADGNCNVMRMYRDQPSDFDAWEIDRRYRMAMLELDEPAVVSVAANGPLFAALRVERRLNRSTLIQEIRVRAGSRRVEFRTTVHWRETNKLLKVDFPVRVHAGESMQEIQFGYVKRPNHASRPHDADRFEACQHKWSALAETNRGFALLNDCKYGISVDGGTMSLTLLRAPTYPDETSDQGTHDFTYGFLFWDGSFFDSPVVREAYELNVPLTVARGRARLTRRSFFETDAASVIVETVKLAEDGSGDWVVRLYESKGASVSCTLRADVPLHAVRETNMLEEPIAAPPFDVDGNAIGLAFRPFEVKTMRLAVNEDPL